ncbi:MAG: sigma-70 family RNA polymerase sigma factor [Opitutaceae bacterium]|jgi:RNA polymerase sigma-70 factor (ECF subfamily)|nr:sigma-70 family RNA polymerase sigma factor [Opitutaceae bacterium]
MPYAPENELLLVAAARQGDFPAWDRLLRHYQRPLHAFINDLTRDETISLDLVQDTFIRAVRHLPTLREDSRFGGWLFSIAHQLCCAHLRRTTRNLEDPIADNNNPPLDTLHDTSQLQPGETLLRDETAATLLATIARLPDAQRTTFTLCVIEEFSLDEISRITGVPLGTVKSRLHHARRALREWLAESPLSPPSPPGSQTRQ